MRRERNQEQEKQWFEHQKKLSSTAEQAHQDKLNLEREKLRSAARVNEWKSKEDKAREYYLNNVLYTNQPSQEYFNQFNTTSR